MKPWEREKLIVERTKEPITRERIVKDLREIGVNEGDVLFVHSSMSKIGWIIGGVVTVINALMEAIGDEGTLMMPGESSGNGEPSHWQYPAVPESWWEIIRRETPPFDPKTTPTRWVGKIPEAFRSFPGVLRSQHPQVSFQAWGKHAEYLVESHPLENPLGEESPLGRFYELEGKILLLGVGHDSNTSIHLAEDKAKLPDFPTIEKGAAILKNGKRVWETWTELLYDSDDFDAIGEAYEESSSYALGHIGQAESRLIEVRSLIDFTIEWMKKNRNYGK